MRILLVALALPASAIRRLPRRCRYRGSGSWRLSVGRTAGRGHPKPPGDRKPHVNGVERLGRPLVDRSAIDVVDQRASNVLPASTNRVSTADYNNSPLPAKAPTAASTTASQPCSGPGCWCKKRLRPRGRVYAIRLSRRQFSAGPEMWVPEKRHRGNTQPKSQGRYQRQIRSYIGFSVRHQVS